MKEVLDTVDNVTGTINGIVRMIVIGLVVIGALILLFGYAITPIVADKVAEKTDEYIEKKESWSERAEQDRQERERRRRLAEDGWGT